MSDELRTSPLHSKHEELGASFTPFGPWNMPLKYGKELEEHRAVREAAGLFDLSHMGEVRVTGAQAAEFLDYALLSTISAVPVGKAKYSMILDPDAGIIDDLITYRLGDQEFLVVPNAGNTAVVVEELTKRAEGFDVTVTDESGDTALVAVQGPHAEDIVAAVISAADDIETMRALKYYSAARLPVAGISDVLVARTGYTGEDGFELYVPNAEAESLWDALLSAGKNIEGGLVPCGLAARDSLRLEAAMPLYGNELSRSISPHDVGLAVLRGKKDCDFVGREALDKRTAETTSTLVGLKGLSKRAARQGSDILNADGEKIGIVTSGIPSPTLGYPIALGFVDKAYSEVATELKVDIRGKHYDVVVASTPFYKRQS